MLKSILVLRIVLYFLFFVVSRNESNKNIFVLHLYLDHNLDANPGCQRNLRIGL